MRHGDPATWYPQMWRWMVAELGARTLLDVGCGEGHCARFFRDAGCEVLAVDGSPQAKRDSVVPESHIVHDFVRGPFVPRRTFDVVWSCEFVEHVEERFADHFLATFASSRKYVFMTYAAPGQPGWHHVNCQPEEYWVEALARCGFLLDRALSQQARRMAGHGHFGNRGLAFVRQHPRGNQTGEA